jgi:hypothetical protein
MDINEIAKHLEPFSRDVDAEKQLNEVEDTQREKHILPEAAYTAIALCW